jgi:aspartyl-tRNA(Asn)/glutamyl-tRNA(Gln) amidotransferase subunit C
MDTDELKITAELAKLSLGEEEAGKLAQMVDQVLSHFSTMMEIDVDHLEPTTHAFQADNVVRKDEVRRLDASRSTHPDDLLDRAPERDDRFITIPNVL